MQLTQLLSGDHQQLIFDPSTVVACGGSRCQQRAEMERRCWTRTPRVPEPRPRGHPTVLTELGFGCKRNQAGSPWHHGNQPRALFLPRVLPRGDGSGQIGTIWGGMRRFGAGWGDLGRDEAVWGAILGRSGLDSESSPGTASPQHFLLTPPGRQLSPLTTVAATSRNPCPPRAAE